MPGLYTDRRLSEQHPDLAGHGHERFEKQTLAVNDRRRARLARLFTYLNRAVAVEPPASIAVIGCGPAPITIRYLLEQGYYVRGVEPVATFVKSAGEFLGQADAVIQGSAEDTALPDQSQDLVLLESVLEHVDSVSKTLAEAYRIVKPGGSVYIVTTNRYYPDVFGRAEYNLFFYNWLPALVKESYVFQHLHYKPSLANYTERPAVHWHTYDSLCRDGREAGFAHFYSLFDMIDETDESIQKSAFRRIIINGIKYNAWLRALAIAAQPVSSILMVRRR